MHSWRIALTAVVLAAVQVQASDASPTQEQRDGFVPLFNGKDLSGWDGDPRIWSAEGGFITGSTDKNSIEQNTFLICKRPFRDFVLRFDIKLRNGNSGMQFRSVAQPGWIVSGYQADASEADDRSAWGNLYDERGKGRGLMRTPDEGWKKAMAIVRKADWNEYEIVAQGRQVILRLNGVETINQEVDNTGEGVIAIQVHRGPAMEVQVRNIRIKSPGAPGRPR